MFAAPALGRLIRGRVRPLISLAHPAPNQVPRLVCAAPPRLVSVTWVLSLSRTQQLPFVEALPGRHADRSQQKVSNPPARVATRAPDAAIHQHVTVLVDTGHPGLRAFGTKRPWVRIPPPRQQNTSSEAVCDRVAMASGDQLRDYRILFRWCIPAVGVLSAVHGGDRLPVASSGTETRPTTMMRSLQR